ncbi:FAD-linked sulfhydryl oxidase ERV2 like protein [Verticillium longisporum]|uniref:Sulfhydryl oxidase n=3 Tax=Verticillium TaxID=1036719 RepID=G2WXE4_VERDV|nr:FAD-linked sulfhydryl oxidase ERV2 [Verticillium dahliae VdLs.17]KAF3351374.1 hypothetical protein VdG2_00881 [Verticillium dahliae VDG2]KAF3356108.1 hypothetical protein VdG1_00223 [Verticillium dahliae VDG1]KAG7128990.1 FAD-linked sulfhydryl oxidase ERV2 like protein [Verticillium longisporum]KAH6707398.1 FAD-linked sulfhydryl oxidase ERV2 [Verticillium dahliae]EGY21399.1 FAD-linked sulfhydryl oxidase ERV2 [Verticillium dahliae VdLs.17]
MTRRQHLSAIVVLAIVAFFSVSYLFSSGIRDGTSSHSAPAPLVKDSTPAAAFDIGTIDSNILVGGSIAPKLENATAKAELGRASWKFLHTMMGRFPDKPSPEESLTLKTFITLFSRLYPCGDCASHFQKLIAKYPPQVSSRTAAAGWLCFVHNEVNTRLEKDLFDCANIGDFYDCGCGDEDKKKKEAGEGVELRGDDSKA